MTSIAPTLQGFFTERLISQRRVSPRTVASYRDSATLPSTFNLNGVVCDSHLSLRSQPSPTQTKPASKHTKATTKTASAPKTKGKAKKPKPAPPRPRLHPAPPHCFLPLCPHPR